MTVTLVGAGSTGSGNATSTNFLLWLGKFVTAVATLVGLTFGYLEVASERDWMPFHPQTFLVLSTPTGGLEIVNQPQISAVATGQVSSENDHVWMVATDEALTWYPLSEAFREGQDGRWSVDLRANQFFKNDSDTRLLLHVVRANPEASAQLAAANSKGSGLNTLPAGAISEDHISAIRKK